MVSDYILIEPAFTQIVAKLTTTDLKLSKVVYVMPIYIWPQTRFGKAYLCQGVSKRAGYFGPS